ncbi:type II toxin-antitoxin system RelE/ParE family toxin [Pararhizobium sp. A13]|uniref:type II toxin-antitoxin system RelE/ParE family toxin n=1 Tax=Pararhizobium sp. A13 TaxID=3133975 RepID=UPI00325375A7
MPEDLEAQIESLAEQTGRSRSLIVNDAIDTYVNNQLRWLSDMDAATRDAKQGQSLDGDEVLDWLESWGGDAEKPRPGPTSLSLSMRIRFTSHALQDLDDLKEWLRLKNPRGYKSVATQISKTIRPVAEHPHMGRRTLRDDIRELVEPRYGFIVPYAVHEGTIFIRYPLDFSASPEPGETL